MTPGPGIVVGTPDHIRGDAYRRLDRFAVEWFLDQFPAYAAQLRSLGEIGGVRSEIAPPDHAGLREAAETVLEEVQGELGALRTCVGDEPLDFQVARRLGGDRYYAILALLEVEPSHKHAKRAQLRITAGEPLAVCTGDACRIGARRERTLRTPFVADPSDSA